MARLLNNNQNQLVYTGDEKYQPQPGEIDSETEEPLYPYLPVSEGLVEAVNLAIHLNRPLLLEGEPGCGKTRLAGAVAYELGKRYLVKNKKSKDENEVKKWPYADWSIKSTDQARDGLYIYDAVRRLFDAQLATTDTSRQEEIRKRLDDSKHEAYIQWGAIGKAFKASQNCQRMVVLIDEIDKGDTDFPNDLLLELEEKRFVVKETGEEVKAKANYAPIIFITSNGQRKLPDAFLRRCLYHYIEFPKLEQLIKIVTARFGKMWSEELRLKAVERFCALRTLMETEKGDFGKKVSTSELIDWLQALQLYSNKEEEIEKLLSEKGLPYSSVLLKSQDDRYYVDTLKDKLKTQPQDFDSE
jgi:MoxR-like ATPase